MGNWQPSRSTRIIISHPTMDCLHSSNSCFPTNAYKKKKKSTTCIPHEKPTKKTTRKLSISRHKFKKIRNCGRDIIMFTVNMLGDAKLLCIIVSPQLLKFFLETPVAYNYQLSGLWASPLSSQQASPSPAPIFIELDKNPNFRYPQALSLQNIRHHPRIATNTVTYFSKLATYQN